MTHLARLVFMAILAMAWAGQGVAQDRTAAVNQIEAALVSIALIERERARSDVPDDFANKHLDFQRRQLAAGNQAADATGQGRAVRAEAQTNANRIINARDRTDYLRYFPDPQRARADLAANSGGIDDATLAGRQAGRMLMLQNALNGFSNNRKPLEVQRRYRLYGLHFVDIRDRMRPTFTDTCSALSIGCQTRNQRFYNAQGRYKWSAATARETAQLYFPEALHARFFDATGIGGSRIGHQAYQEELREERRQREEEAARWRQGSGNSNAGAVLAVLAILGFIGFLIYLATRRKEEEQKPLSGNFGTADYAKPVHQIDGALFKGVFLGGSAHTLFPRNFFGPIVTKPETHTLIVAPSGTGKGTRVVVPTLMLYKSSLVTIDPKGENACITARYRREQLGHSVYIINPWGMHDALLKSHGFSRATFNPLDVLDPRDENFVSAAKSLATNICIQGNAKDDYWQTNAASILAAVLIWVADHPGEQKTLANVADIISGGAEGNDLRATLFPRMIASSTFGPALRILVGRFLKMDDKTYSGILSQLAKSIQFLADSQIAKSTAQSSFHLPDLVNGRTTLYIVIPDNQMHAQATWLRLVVNAVTETFKRYQPAGKGVRGMFLIDEFPVLGRVDSIVTDIALVRGAGLDLTLIVQGLDQLHSLYGPSAGTILTNCGYKWFCNVKDLQTAEYVSKSLGQMTVRTVSETISGGQGHTTRSHGETGRAMLFPDEIMSMDRSIAWAFQPRGRAHYLRPVDYWHLWAYLPPRAEQSEPPIRLPDLKAFDINPYFDQARREQEEASKASGSMDRAEALAVLGLEDGASEEQIREAYKRLMTMIHPDKGGTTYLAQKLNQARDLLLGKR